MHVVTKNFMKPTKNAKQTNEFWCDFSIWKSSSMWVPIQCNKTESPWFSEKAVKILLSSSIASPARLEIPHLLQPSQHVWQIKEILKISIQILCPFLKLIALLNFFLILLRLIYLFGSQSYGERKIIQPLGLFPNNNGQDWIRLKPETRNFTCVSHIGEKV